MKTFKKLIILLTILSVNVFVGQNDTLRILDKNAIISSDENGKLYYIFKIKDDNPNFEWDSFKFIIPNQKNFEEYYSLKEMQQEIDVDSIKSKNISELSKQMTNWEIHNYLSNKKKIYLIHKMKNSLSKNNYTVYYSYPLIYKGTQKNLEVLNMQ